MTGVKNDRILFELPQLGKRPIEVDRYCKSAIESEEMQAFFEENPNFRTAVEQLPLTRPQDAARVFIPNGDQIIGAGLERIVINFEDPQVVFDEVANTLTDEAQPVKEAIAALG